MCRNDSASSEGHNTGDLGTRSQAPASWLWEGHSRAWVHGSYGSVETGLPPSRRNSSSDAVSVFFQGTSGSVLGLWSVIINRTMIKSQHHRVGFGGSQHPCVTLSERPLLLGRSVWGHLLKSVGGSSDHWSCTLAALENFLHVCFKQKCLIKMSFLFPFAHIDPDCEGERGGKWQRRQRQDVIYHNADSAVLCCDSLPWWVVMQWLGVYTQWWLALSFRNPSP